MLSASSMCEPRNRSGRWTLRMKKAIAIPTATSVPNTSTTRRKGGHSPSNGDVQSRSTIAIAASAIVGNRTRKPQKIRACISPGGAFWKSLRWPSTWSSSPATLAVR